MPVRKATAVVSAPGEAGRVQKMMSARPTLNANRRTAPKQDLSGASPDGTLVGRGGRTQQLGKAAMARMPPPSAAPPPQDSPEVQAFMAANPGLTPDFIRNAAGQGQTPGMPQSLTRPAQLQGQALQDAMMRRGMPAGFGALPPGAAEMATRPMPGAVGGMLQGLASGVDLPMERGGAGMETAEMGGQANGARMAMPSGPLPSPNGYGQGIPLQIIQRLQALRGGGMQGGAPPAPRGGGGMGSSFADFWARQQGNGGMAY